jgi:hypothetical protein
MYAIIGSHFVPLEGKFLLIVGIAAENLCFLVVVCTSRNGMHFELLKSDNICSFYTNLNIEKYAVVLAGKPIITDI